MNRKIICSKDNIILKRLKNEDEENEDEENEDEENEYIYFGIDFQLNNKDNLDMKSIINYKLFNLIGIINKDIIEKSEIINKISDQEIDVLYVFKRFGQDLGISKKYCYFKTFIESDNNKIQISNYSIPYLDSINEEPILCKDAKITITNLDKSLININYNFKLSIGEELPIYMQNILGILMKKILKNFKIFMENININSLDISIINNVNDKEI